MRHVICLLALGAWCAASCLHIDDAVRKIGSTACVKGKVTHITQGPNGIQYVDFCEEHNKCPFRGVVPAEDLRDVGDIRTLPGKTIELHGELREYESHAEIVIREARQVRGAEVKLPPVPKTYDVEQRGHFSAGSIKPFKHAKPAKPKRHPPLPAGGLEIPPDDEPQ
jgi:hypothetical protein